MRNLNVAPREILEFQEKQLRIVMNFLVCYLALLTSHLEIVSIF